MSRITKIQKQIADRYIDAKINDTFNPPPYKITGKDDVIKSINDGYTIPELYDEIQFRNVSITSMLYQSALSYTTKAYKTSMYNGFKKLLNDLNIN
jgi:predicted choloylglycine hydrolase